MPSKKSQAIQPHQIGTRASNKLAHPGQVAKTSTCRTSAEVQQERKAKAKAKADCDDAKQQSIIRAAEFERAEMANEDMVNTTPCPPFTPKPWPPPRNKKKAGKVVESSDVEMDQLDASSLSPVYKDDSVTESDSPVGSDSESVTESDSDNPTPPPPTKKQKVQAAPTVRGSGKVTHSKGKVGSATKVEITTEEEQMSTPKKVTKAKVRDEINF